ncbi:hypothetical protein BCR42DRAFT_442507 [Absidia repens]|uniref:Cyclin-domain-containing protein n=1 Tax=Absidia repens TaxID=90262 RepID=A0A1X2I2I7_9FUNG|nr:hypothetical protein BCR42DRAFT_442507 [Absidia repens]
MHLRVETAQPYTLFPTKPTFVSHPPHPPPTASYPYPPHSTLGYHHQPFANSLPYPHQYHPQQYHHHTYSYGGASYHNANAVKRSSSAFEPLFYQLQQHVLPPSPPTTPISDMDRSPTLADFAASIVYLMWHARKPFLVAATKPSSPYRHSFSSSVSGNASPAFKRFCLQVLTATQLSESAVFLALKYIANLLESNPSIEGAEGSEYRLFIVALMLANKFLDDNTFTNKTWSEVSGMKVQDLNIMESEFLEALEYHLFVREEEYMTWKSVLDTCRQRYGQQHALMMMMPTNTTTLADPHSLQRQEWITSTLHSLGLYKSSDGNKHLDDDQQQHHYIETDDDDDDDEDEDEEVVDDEDDDDDDDDDEMFQMMHQQHHLQQQEEQQQRTLWPAAAPAATREHQQHHHHPFYRMQQEQHSYPSMTTPPLSLPSSHPRAERSSAFSRPTSDTTRNDTGRSSSSSFMQYSSGASSTHHHASLQPHRSSSVYRSSVPPGFQRRSSPWEPLRDRCGESFYSHQPFHPYQRQPATFAPPLPPPSLRTATTAWGG